MTIAKLRTKITETAQGLNLEIPYRREYFKCLFLSVWLTGWAFGEATVIAVIISSIMKWNVNSGISAFGSVFMLVWLAGWTVGGIFAFNELVPSLFGKEIIEISKYEIIICQKVIFRRQRQFDVSAISDFRLAPEEIAPKGAFLFDHGPETIQFGLNIDYAEAKILAKQISEIVPVKINPADSEYVTEESYVQGENL